METLFANNDMVHGETEKDKVVWARMRWWYWHERLAKGSKLSSQNRIGCCDHWKRKRRDVGVTGYHLFEIAGHGHSCKVW